MPAIFVCRPKANLSLTAGDESNHAAALVRTRFGVLVHVHQHVLSSSVPSPSGIDLSFATK